MSQVYMSANKLQAKFKFLGDRIRFDTHQNSKELFKFETRNRNHWNGLEQEGITGGSNVNHIALRICGLI